MEEVWAVEGWVSVYFSMLQGTSNTNQALCNNISSSHTTAYNARDRQNHGSAKSILHIPNAGVAA